MNFWQAFKMKREWANELKKDDFSRQEIQDTQRILKEERKYLLSRLPDERSFLQDHFSYGYLYEKDDASDGLLQQQRDIIQKQIYQYKRLLLENDTDYHVKETSLFQEHCDEYRKEYVFCYLYF